MAELIHRRQGIRDLPEILYQLGVEKAVICPGSRNAPLILAFVKHGKQESLSIVDERSAAYFALGMAQYSQKPVALICTSGTAVLNFAPAIAEAFYQNIPLIVITADRPAEWIDQADGQTIRQQGIFANYIKASFQIPGETIHPDDLWHSNRTVSQAVGTAESFPKGPVHLNIPLREPLYAALPEQFSGKHLMVSSLPEHVLSAKDMDYILKKRVHDTKIWLVVGVASPNPELTQTIQDLSERGDILVLAENISNISGESIIDTPESWIASLTNDEKENLRPTLLITIGHSLVSKRLKQYLRTYPPKEQWQVGENSHPTDTFQCLSRTFISSAKAFLTLMKDFPGSNSTLKQEASTLKTLLEEKQSFYLQQAPFSDFVAIDQLLKSVPENSIVHLANSTPVRYAQLFKSQPNLTYYCNRGTSGIDGCTSTAMGSAHISGRPTVLLTGDLAFLYDSNAFWNRHLPLYFKTIVVNNNGGNIFSLIETSEEMNSVRPYFETPHQVKISALAEGYGLSYFQITQTADFNQVLSDFWACKKPSLLEIVTNAEINTKVYREYFAKVLNRKL